MRLALIALLAAPAAGEPILHEFVPPGEEDLGAASDDGGEAASAPSDDAPLLDAESVEPFRPDRRTLREGLLAYHEPFSPSVAPFKRGAARDRVLDGYALVVGDPTLRAVPIEPGPTGGEAFTAALLVRFEPGRAVLVPSVAPGARIRALVADPPASVEALRDGADNLFLRADARGPHRVTLRLDAAPAYFSARVHPGLTPAAVPPALRPALPPAEREAGEVVLARLGVSARDPIDRSLPRLVGAFRAFEAGALDEPTGDPYLDLALGGRGICRHRAFAFVVTVQALGLPARYVDNEAHAFAEVWLPRAGWTRVDLGGDALRLEILGAADKQLHRGGPDPFPQPLAFAEGVSRLRGAVDGAPLDAAAPRPARLDERPLPAAGEGAGGDEDARPALRIAIERQEGSGVRGEPIRVEGRAEPGVPLDAYLSPDGERRGLWLGQTVADGEGRFRLAVTVPRDAPVGRYQVVVASPGDARFAPGRSP